MEHFGAPRLDPRPFRRARPGCAPKPRDVLQLLKPIHLVPADVGLHVRGGLVRRRARRALVVRGGLAGGGGGGFFLPPGGGGLAGPPGLRHQPGGE